MTTRVDRSAGRVVPINHSPPCRPGSRRCSLRWCSSPSREMRAAPFNGSSLGRVLLGLAAHPHIVLEQTSRTQRAAASAAAGVHRRRGTPKQSESSGLKRCLKAPCKHAQGIRPRKPSDRTAIMLCFPPLAPTSSTTSGFLAANCSAYVNALSSSRSCGRNVDLLLRCGCAPRDVAPSRITPTTMELSLYRNSAASAGRAL